MKRILYYFVLLVAMIMLPVERLDIGKLKPVQAVSVSREKEWWILKTDTGDYGFGTTPKQALQNLKETTSGIIYLDTTRYLLLETGTEEVVEELRPELRKSVGLCATVGKVSTDKAAEYLSAQGNLPKLKQWKLGQELPVITVYKERINFLKKVENKA